MKSLSHVWIFATPWTVADQAPQSIEFSRQEYWSGVPFPSPGDLPGPGIEPVSLTLWADTLPSEPPGKPLWENGVSNVDLLECFRVYMTSLMQVNIVRGNINWKSGYLQIKNIQWTHRNSKERNSSIKQKKTVETQKEKCTKNKGSIENYKIN